MVTEPLKVRRPGSEKALVGWEWGDSAAPGNVEDLEILELNQYDVPEEFGVAREENTQNAWGDVRGNVLRLNRYIYCTWVVELLCTTYHMINANMDLLLKFLNTKKKKKRKKTEDKINTMHEP